MTRAALLAPALVVASIGAPARAADVLERVAQRLQRPPSPIGEQVAQARQQLAAVDAQIAATRQEHFLRTDSAGARGRARLASALAPLQAQQRELSERYVALLQQNEGLAGVTITGSFDASLFSVPGYVDVGVKLGGRVSGEGTGRPLVQVAPDLIIDTAAGLYGNVTWDPDARKISPSYTVGVGPVAATTYNPLYGKRLQLIIPGLFKVGISRSCLGGTCKVGLPVGPRVGGTVFVEHPRLLPLNNWLFDRIEGVAAVLARIPGVEQRGYDARRALTRAKAKVVAIAPGKRLTNPP